MSTRRTGSRRLWFGASAVAILMAFTAAGTVAADSGGPGSIHVASTGALSVSASGTWSWAEMATATKLSYTGFAIDWGDVTSGNTVGTYHLGDGTPATNFVMQPTSPAQGPSGSWGAVSHTYASPGTYTVCAIIYDLGQVTPFKSTGYHSLQAGGSGRNTDNSVDQDHSAPVSCTKVDVAAPAATPFESFQGETATPFESFEGETAVPSATPPVTATSNGTSSPDQGLPWLVLALTLGAISVLAVAARTAKVRR